MLEIEFYLNSSAVVRAGKIDGEREGAEDELEELGDERF